MPMQRKNSNRNDREGRGGDRDRDREHDLMPARKRQRPMGSDEIIDENDVEFLKRFVTEYGKIIPARITGTICEVQNDLSCRDNWLKYNTVVINLIDSDPASTDGCTPGQDFSFRYFSVQMPGKGFAGFDPLKLAGTEASFVGMLMNSASKSGKTLYWTVAVRSASDVCLTPRTGC